MNPSIQQAFMPYLEGPPRHFVVALSGGLDSMVLLDLSWQLLVNHPRHRLSAIHVHHGLSEHADAWEQHCRQQCQQRAIPLRVVRVTISREPRASIEAEARDARYAAIAKACDDDSLLLLGQHRDDQAETLLLQLKRGAGPKGLSGMGQEGINAYGTPFLRPLLDLSRQQLCAMAKARGLDWVDDESNQDERFDRNFIRQQVLPLLNQRFGDIAVPLARSARLIAQEHQLLQEVVQARLTGLCQGPGQLQLSGLWNYSEAWQRQLLRAWLSGFMDWPPSETQLREILKQARMASRDSQMQLDFAEGCVRRFNHSLYWVPTAEAAQPGQLTAGQWLACPAGRIGLVLDPGDTPILARVPGNTVLSVIYGELNRRFRPEGHTQSKPLKQWLKAWSVPPWERQRLPQVLLGEDIICLPSLAKRSMSAAQTGGEWALVYQSGSPTDGD